MRFLAALVLLTLPSISYATEKNLVTEYPLQWPGDVSGSTHELLFDPADGGAVWVTGQNFDHLARVNLSTGVATFFPMPEGSHPHGMIFDASGQFWVALEYAGMVARVNRKGEIEERVDVRLHARGAAQPINTYPHGLALDADGKTIWFTGKKTSTVGKINPDKTVEHFELPALGAVPIYLHSGPDGNMWGTALQGNNILRVMPSGEVTEFDIPTYNSRPIAIVPGPDGQSMWFSEEAGHQVARIDMDGTITEFAVPMKAQNMILAGLAFDSEGNLWTQSYVDQNNPTPAGSDYIVRLDKAINQAASGDLSDVAIDYYQVPTKNTGFHRIQQGPDGNIWFTELKADRIGRLRRP